jgi:hypothetical protein
MEPTTGTENWHHLFSRTPIYFISISSGSLSGQFTTFFGYLILFSLPSPLPLFSSTALGMRSRTVESEGGARLAKAAGKVGTHPRRRGSGVASPASGDAGSSQAALRRGVAPARGKRRLRRGAGLGLRQQAAAAAQDSSTRRRNSRRPRAH